MHHAYLLVGQGQAREFVEEKFGPLKASPDFFLYTGTFGIDEARALSSAASKKAFGERKIFLITPEKISSEAQNALLKTFEDPVPDTHFFLAVRDENLIIPTLRSRMELVRLKETEEENDVKKFLKLSIKERLNFARKFADSEKNLSVFLDELMKIYKESESLQALKSIYPLRLYSDDRSASSRLILEHLSLVL